MKNAWRDLEDSIIAALDAGMAPNGPWRCVGSYSSLAADIVTLGTKGLVPAALVSIEAANWQASDIGYERQTESVQVVVVIVWRHPAGNAATRRGTPGHDGLYALIHRVIAALSDLEHDEWATLRPRRYDTYRQDASYMLASLIFETSRQASLDELHCRTWDDLTELTIGIGDESDTAATLDTVIDLSSDLGEEEE